MPGKQLADIDPRNVRGDRVKRPAILRRAFGFMSYISRCGGPPGNQMKMTEGVVFVAGMLAGLGSHPQDIRQSQPAKPQGSCLQK